MKRPIPITNYAETLSAAECAAIMRFAETWKPGDVLVVDKATADGNESQYREDVAL